MLIEKLNSDIMPPKIEEAEVNMPLRKCPYCKGLCNFDISRLMVEVPGTPGSVRIDTCQNCHMPVYFHYRTGDFNAIIDSYPEADTELDEELPDNVKIAFREALAALDQGLWNGCVTMCRRSLQESMDDLMAAGDSLFKQIDDLEKKRKIIQELKEWANEGRLGGNLGAHGTKDKKWADKKDAEEVVEFCRWFFRYVYVLPKQLAERRKRIAEPKT